MKLRIAQLIIRACAGIGLVITGEQAEYVAAAVIIVVEVVVDSFLHKKQKASVENESR